MWGNCMSIKESYEKLPFDLSGARTKNRFDFEILYGIELLIDNYHVLNDFTVVFDYVCDIELHCNDDESLKFYQVKTTNTGKPNNINFLTKKDNKSKDSIIGKIYKISNNNTSSNISVLLVSNAPLINNKFVTKPNEAILLSDIDDTNLILEKLGYKARSYQENRRIRYVYNNIEIDIDSWPLIPTYVEFEGTSEEEIREFVKLLGYKTSDLTTLNVNKIYEYYGLDIDSYAVLKFD